MIVADGEAGERKDSLLVSGALVVNRFLIFSVLSSTLWPLTASRPRDCRSTELYLFAMMEVSYISRAKPQSASQFPIKMYSKNI